MWRIQTVTSLCLKKGFKKACGRLYVFIMGELLADQNGDEVIFGLLFKVLCFWTLTFHLKLFGEALRYELEQSDGDYLLVCVCCITIQNFLIIYVFICQYLVLFFFFSKVCKMSFGFVEGVNWSLHILTQRVVWKYKQQCKKTWVFGQLLANEIILELLGS